MTPTRGRVTEPENYWTFVGRFLVNSRELSPWVGTANRDTSSKHFLLTFSCGNEQLASTTISSHPHSFTSSHLVSKHSSTTQQVQVCLLHDGAIKHFLTHRFTPHSIDDILGGDTGSTDQGLVDAKKVNGDSPLNLCVTKGCFPKVYILWLLTLQDLLNLLGRRTREEKMLTWNKNVMMSMEERRWGQPSLASRSLSLRRVLRVRNIFHLRREQKWPILFKWPNNRYKLVEDLKFSNNLYFRWRFGSRTEEQSGRRQRTSPMQRRLSSWRTSWDLENTTVRKWYVMPKVSVFTDLFFSRNQYHIS